MTDSTSSMENVNGWRGSPWRTTAWIGAALLLLLPLIAMQFTDEVVWGVGDFVFAGVLLFGSLGAYEIAARKTGDAAYRAGAGVALLGALLLLWANGAVGIIGSESHDANLMYLGVLAVGVVGAFIARFRPEGMARALFATAIAQAVVAVVALSAGWGEAKDIVLATLFFCALFAGSALLFQRAARGKAAEGAD